MISKPVGYTTSLLVDKRKPIVIGALISTNLRGVKWLIKVYSSIYPGTKYLCAWNVIKGCLQNGKFRKALIFMKNDHLHLISYKKWYWQLKITFSSLVTQVNSLLHLVSVYSVIKFNWPSVAWNASKYLHLTHGTTCAVSLSLCSQLLLFW